VTALDSLIDEIADRVAARVAERLRAGEPGMIDQSASPLGRRRHCAAVRRLVARGEPGAAIVGRRHLLSREALADALARCGKAAAAPVQQGGGVRDELERELRMVKGGRR
jgi:hypothetical protein